MIGGAGMDSPSRAIPAEMVVVGLVIIGIKVLKENSLV